MAQSFTDQQRSDFAQQIMLLLDEWRIDLQQRIDLLGLPADIKPRALGRFRQGAPLPDDDETMKRVGYLLSIHHSLGFTFPHNPTLARYWITTACYRFNDRTPLEVMLEQGLEGLEMVARHLDNSDDWG